MFDDGYHFNISTNVENLASTKLQAILHFSLILYFFIVHDVYVYVLNACILLCCLSGVINNNNIA